MTDPLSAVEADLDAGRSPELARLRPVLTAEFVRDHVDRLLRCVTRLGRESYREDVDWLLTTIREVCAPATDEAIRAANHQALRAARRGDHARALEILHDIHIDAGRAGSPVLATIVANLAGGDHGAGAHAQARRGSAIPLTGPPGLVAASVATVVARFTADWDAFHQAAEEQRLRTAEYVEDADSGDPVALGSIANVTALGTETEGDEQTLDRLEIAVQRNAAVLGMRHPQTVVAAANMASARFRFERDHGTPAQVRAVLAMLFTASQQTAEYLGFDHPQALVARANLVSAQFEIARAELAPVQARQLLPELRVVADELARALGIGHPQALVALSNLATAEFELARWEGSREGASHALGVLTVASERSAAVLGPAHPATLVLNEELRMCTEMADEDDPGRAALLVKVRTRKGTPFGDDYVPVGEARKPSDVPEPPLSTVIFPPLSVEQLFADLRDVPSIPRTGPRAFLRRLVEMRPQLTADLDMAGRPWRLTARLVAVVLRGATGAKADDRLELLRDIANWSGHAGDPDGAAVLLEQVAEELANRLGDLHPAVLAARVDSAHWLGVSGHARLALEQVVEVMRAQDQPSETTTTQMLVTRNNYVHWYGHTTSPKQAARLLVPVIDEMETLLGPDHVYTLAARNNQSCWRGKAGYSATAVSELRKLHTRMVEVLGSDHPDTLATQNNLAYWLGHSGQPALAADELGRLLSHQIRLLGRDHPEVLITMANLEGWRERA